MKIFQKNTIVFISMTMRTRDVPRSQIKFKTFSKTLQNLSSTQINVAIIKMFAIASNHIRIMNLISIHLNIKSLHAPKNKNVQFFLKHTVLFCIKMKEAEMPLYNSLKISNRLEFIKKIFKLFKISVNFWCSSKFRNF